MTWEKSRVSHNFLARKKMEEEIFTYSQSLPSIRACLILQYRIHINRLDAVCNKWNFLKNALCDMKPLIFIRASINTHKLK